MPRVGICEFLSWLRCSSGGERGTYEGYDLPEAPEGEHDTEEHGELDVLEMRKREDIHDDEVATTRVGELEMCVEIDAVRWIFILENSMMQAAVYQVSSRSHDAVGLLTCLRARV